MTRFVTSESSHCLVYALHRFHCFYWMFDEYNTMPQDSQDRVTAGASATATDGATALYNGHVGGSSGVGGDMESETDMQEEQQGPSRRTTLVSEQVLGAFCSVLLLLASLWAFFLLAVYILRGNQHLAA